MYHCSGSIISLADRNRGNHLSDRGVQNGPLFVPAAFE
jgi:hypothetical protein